ncbi:hypothetical protein R6Q59_003391 [Mikania micrantha]
MKVFDLADVSLHNNRKDCWVIINARVYDVTNFLNDHPGGDNVLLDVAGKNASEEFEEAGHGSASRLMLDEYYVGEANLTTSSSSGISLATNPQAQAHPEPTMHSWFGFVMKPVGLLNLPLAILGVVIGYMLYK